ncbi:MAG TPA: glycogen-debranching protein, partial [Polyangia bacterium]
MANGRTDGAGTRSGGRTGTIEARGGGGGVRSIERASVDWFADRGAPYPVGASHVPESNAYNFTLYSRNATRVELLLYRDDFVTPRKRIALDPLRNRSGRVWHTRLPTADLEGARYYAYLVDGPRGPGHRFDPDKVLLDPYARAIFFPPQFNRAAASRPGSNAGQAPLGVI